MKILVTDYAWDDLKIEREILRQVGADLLVAKAGSEDELIGLSPAVEGIMTNWKLVTRRVIESAPQCKAIARYGVGLDNIDVQFATDMGILVTNVPNYCLEEVSDHAIALLLALARKVGFYNQATKSGHYDLRAGTPLFRIKGKTLGVIGFGKIGRLVSQKAKAFGLNVVVYDGHSEINPRSDAEVERVTFVSLLQRSDFVSIHVPLTATTRHFINFDVFRQMKPQAFVINTSRGGVIDSNALLKALNEGLIAGAALDVLSAEPPEPGDPLVLHPKTIITPHVAFNSVESVEELRRTAASQILDVLRGKMPHFVVNPGVLKQPNLRAALKD